MENDKTEVLIYLLSSVVYIVLSAIIVYFLSNESTLSTWIWPLLTTVFIMLGINLVIEQTELYNNNPDIVYWTYLRYTIYIICLFLTLACFIGSICTTSTRPWLWVTFCILIILYIMLNLFGYYIPSIFCILLSTILFLLSSAALLYNNNFSYSVLMVTMISYIFLYVSCLFVCILEHKENILNNTKRYPLSFYY